MAITYPREMPPYKMQRCAARLLDNVATSPSGAGEFINITRRNRPTWQLNVETGLLYPEQVAEFSAWKNSLDGGLKQFLAFDVRRRKPRAHPNFTTATADVTALSATTITLGGVAGYTASAGDRVGLEQNGRYGYYEVIETVTANGSGVIVLSVRPNVHLSYFNASAVARLIDAKAKYVIDWQSWNEPETPGAASIIFSGMQRL